MKNRVCRDSCVSIIFFSIRWYSPDWEEHVLWNIKGWSEISSWIFGIGAPNPAISSRSPSRPPTTLPERFGYGFEQTVSIAVGSKLIYFVVDLFFPFVFDNYLCSSFRFQNTEINFVLSSGDISWVTKVQPN